VCRVSSGRGRRPHGDGSVFAYRAGFAAVLDLGWVQGRRRRRWLYGATQSEVVAKLDAAKRDRRAGVDLAVPPRTFGVWCIEWLAMKQRAETRPLTVRGYRALVVSHLAPTLGRVRLDAVTPTLIRRLVEAKTDAGLPTATVRQIHGLIRNILADAEREELVVRNAAKAVRPPALHRPERRALTVTEARRLLKVIAGDRLEAVWVCALSLGLRRGELLGLRWSDIEFGNEATNGWGPTVTVRQTLLRVGGRLVVCPPKILGSRRVIPMPPEVVQHVERHRVRQSAERDLAGVRWVESGLVFTSTIGTPLEPRNVDRSWHVIRERADLGWLRLHDLRHACATFLLASGASPRTVMKVLGHSQISLTMNTYAHVLPEVERGAVDDAARALYG
jgi:integrase